MKRSWNPSLWIGFVFALLGFFSYIFFVQFPITRDFPWVNLLLFAFGAIFLAVGLKRAFGKPDGYRGKIFGSIFALLSLGAFAFFSFIVFYELKQLPESKGAPRVGEKAPDFSLPNENNELTTLANLISSKAPNGKPGAVLLIFYRGFW